jgi:hypothetical protein
MKLKTWQIVALVFVAIIGFGSYFGQGDTVQVDNNPIPTQSQSPEESSPQPEPSEGADLGEQEKLAIDSVKANYGDCFALLPLQGEFVYTATPNDTTKDLGEVLITIPGGILTFTTGTAPGGAFLTVVKDDETRGILEGVGCEVF